MTAVYLLIPDPALADAIAEQIKASPSGLVRDNALPDAPPKELTAVLIDEAACDGKNVKKLCAIRNDKCVVLLLGSPPDAFDETLVTEIFPKPIRLGHLMARLRFHLEVAPKLRSTPISIGPFRFEAQQRSLLNGAEVIRLTEKESALLEYLAQSASPVAREELLASVWGYDAHIDTHTLETHIYQLRRKLGNELILNEGGFYRLAR